MAWFVLLAIVAALVVVSILRPRIVILHDYQRGLLYSLGKLKVELTPGAYWTIWPLRLIRPVDLRARVLTIPGQEVPTADNVALKVSLAVRLRVADARKAIHEAESFEDALYLEAQLILRDLLAALPVEEVLLKRDQVTAQLRERLEAKAAPLGLALETVGLKDVMFPGGLRQIFAQVVEARKAAQASLERARGETATLRNLANAASMIDRNPSLMALRTLQTAGDGKHTLVFGLSQTPFIPLKNGHSPPPNGGHAVGDVDQSQ